MAREHWSSCCAALLALGCGASVPAAGPPAAAVWVPAENPQSVAKDSEALIDGPSAEARAVAGTWEDLDAEDHTWFTIELDGPKPVLRSAVGTAGDREVFVVRDSRWNGHSLTFTYYVPSTQYEVTFTTDAVTPTELRAHWSNSGGATGTVVMPRVDVGPPRTSLVGAWAWEEDIQVYGPGGTGTYYRGGNVCYGFRYVVQGNAYTELADRDSPCLGQRQNTFRFRFAGSQLILQHVGSEYETRWRPVQTP